MKTFLTLDRWRPSRTSPGNICRQVSMPAKSVVKPTQVEAMRAAFEMIEHQRDLLSSTAADPTGSGRRGEPGQ